MRVEISFGKKLFYFTYFYDMISFNKVIIAIIRLCNNIISCQKEDILSNDKKSYFST